MTLRENIREEFRRSPLTVIATVAGVLVATLALLVAWLQYAGQPAVAPAVAAAAVPATELRLSNLLVVVSFFLAASFGAASAIHLLERSHPFPATVLSVPVAIAASFGTLLVLKFAPPRPLNPELLESARTLVFWATLFVFVAVNGLNVLREFALPRTRSSSSSGTPEPPTQPDGLTALAGILMLLAVWGGLVSAGLSKLTQIFLT